MKRRVINILASVIVAASVVAVMVALDAPTWAWVGIGSAIYLNEIKTGVTA